MTLMLWDQAATAWVPLYPDGQVPPPSPPPVWPDATNTGYLGSMGALTDLAGYTVSTPGTVIENRRINDAIRPNAGNIVIRNPAGGFRAHLGLGPAGRPGRDPSVPALHRLGDPRGRRTHLRAARVVACRPEVAPGPGPAPRARHCLGIAPSITTGGY